MYILEDLPKRSDLCRVRLLKGPPISGEVSHLLKLHRDIFEHCRRALYIEVGELTSIAGADLALINIEEDKNGCKYIFDQSLHSQI